MRSTLKSTKLVILKLSDSCSLPSFKLFLKMATTDWYERSSISIDKCHLVTVQSNHFN